MQNQYLTFTLDNTMYAAEVSSVQEVLEYENPQPLPCPDPVIKGIVRSRGKSISVINTRRKFGLADCDPGPETRIIVFEIPDDEQGIVNCIGAIADSVLEVLEIDTAAIEPPPAAGHSEASKFITGISDKDDRFIIILDIAKLFSIKELTNITSFAEAAKEK